MEWTETLAQAGVEVGTTSQDSAELTYQSDVRTFDVIFRARPPRPSEVKDPPTEASLLVVSSLSPAVRDLLTRRGWSWVDEAGNAHVDFGTTRAQSEGSATPAPAAAVPGLRAQGKTSFRLLRRLLEVPHDAPVRQVDLAKLSGLRQSQISRALSAMEADGLVEAGYRTTRLTSRQAALRHWLNGYPGPGGVATHWMGLSDVWVSTLSALKKLPDDTVVSSSVAVDLLAPWSRPTKAILYARQGADLAAAGLIQVGSSEPAHVTVQVPLDPTVWPTTPIEREFQGKQVRVADPLQVLWDLRWASGPDTEEAADRFGKWVAASLDLESL